MRPMTLFSAVTALEDDILLLAESWCGAISPNFLTQCGQSIVLKRSFGYVGDVPIMIDSRIGLL